MSPRVMVADVIRAASEVMAVSEQEILGRSHGRRETRPRHLAMAVARELTPSSLAGIGRAFRRDHSTVVLAIRSVRQRASHPDWSTPLPAIRARAVELAGQREAAYRVGAADATQGSAP